MKAKDAKILWDKAEEALEKDPYQMDLETQSKIDKAREAVADLSDEEFEKFASDY